MDIFTSAFLIVSGMKAKENIDELVENIKEGTRNDALSLTDEQLSALNRIEGNAAQDRWDALLKAGYTAEDIAKM